MKKVSFCSVAAGQTELRHSTGQETGLYSSIQAAVQRQISVAQVGGGAEAAGSPELSLAHGRTPNRGENSHPQRKAKGFVLTKIF